ncbi:MAG: thioredoxin-dependent thiol peroxidase [Rhodothermales bacterium]|nr:thioredoxin-dependent thiol peroxidase [Rhodothermales bacterium]
MAEVTTMPEVGQPAPSFEGTTQDGTTVRLEDYRGRRLALYFYPKDDTPGCTKQACNLRDHYRDLLEAGIAVVGVSPDPVESHEAFADKYELPFPLLADPAHEILEAYGVWGERNLYGRTFMGVKRTTFLIDEEGIVRHVFKRPKVSEHTQEILKRFEAV